MAVSPTLMAAVFAISLVLTMVGLGGGLIFPPLFVILAGLGEVGDGYLVWLWLKNF